MCEVDQLHHIHYLAQSQAGQHIWDRQQKKGHPLIIDQAPLYPLSQRKTLKSRRRSKLEQPRPYKAEDMACNENSRKTTHLVVIGPILSHTSTSVGPRGPWRLGLSPSLKSPQDAPHGGVDDLFDLFLFSSRASVPIY